MMGFISYIIFYSYHKKPFLLIFQAFKAYTRKIFDIYDFNELNSLSKVDIEFMLIAV